MNEYTFTITASFYADELEEALDQFAEWLTDPSHVEHGAVVVSTFSV